METMKRLTAAARHFTPHGLAPGAIAILALVAALGLPDPQAWVATMRNAPLETSAPAEPAAQLLTGVPDAKAVFEGQVFMPEAAPPTF